MVRRWWLWALAGILVLACVWVGLQPQASLSDRLGARVQGPADLPVRAATADAKSAASNAGSLTAAPFHTLLLADGGVGARADSVRIGLAQISVDDARTYQEWLEGGSQGAGPAERSELATVERWMAVAATRRSDGAVEAGPLQLPWADRYDLQARGDDALHYYLTSFTADAYPVTVSPTIAAGMRVSYEPLEGSAARVLLRRASEPSEAVKWQDLMAREAPQLLAALSESPLAIATGQVLAPLPPGLYEVIFQVDGIEAQRQPIELRAGSIAELGFDAIAAQVARTISVNLELSFVVEGTREPVRELSVIVGVNAGEQSRTTDQGGRVLFEGLDRQRRAQLKLSFPRTDGGLPRWPEQRTIELDLDALLAENSTESARSPSAAKLLRKLIELRPLQWLLVRTGAFPLSPERRVGNPYPIFVLQHERDGSWTEVAAEFFLPVPEGLAVSIETLGKFRLAAVQMPWRVLYSTAADNQVRSADGRYRAELLTAPGRRVELRVLHQGQPLAHAPIDVRGPIRNLPDSNLSTDASGQLQLDAVTVPGLRLEVTGFAVAEVELRSAMTTVELQRDSDSGAD